MTSSPPADDSNADPSALPRPFVRLAWANLAAQSAEQLSLAAVPIVAVLALGAGAGEIGALGVAQTLPYLLLSIPFGLLADRTSRRRLIVLAEGLRALTLVGLMLAVATGHLSLGLLAVLGFLGAVGTVGFSVAAPALVPALVPRAALARANGRLELARTSSGERFCVWASGRVIATPVRRPARARGRLVRDFIMA
jgi:MFS family permease